MKQSSPKLNILEHVALELAATFYEVGRGQGLKSKYKTARAYAFANLEKFVPHATKHLLSMLHRSDISVDQKNEIYDCIMERVNDPTAQSLAESSEGHALPDIDIAKLIPVQELPSVIVDKRATVDYGLAPLFKGKLN